MYRVVIIGADGFGEAVADILFHLPLGPSVPAPVGFLDDATHLHGRALFGLRVLGPVSELANVPHDAVVVAIADNDLRRRCYQRLRRRGERILGAVHPSATLAQRVTLGEGSLVAAGAIVGTGCAIGEGSILDAGCVLGHGCQVGAFAYVGPGANLGFDVVLKDLALIGAAATVVPDQRIGIDARVAAHALVAQHVPEGGSVLSAVSRRY
jgi:sugar O-acyltransferase (sialic acid O-acetyltransferase NeuD family)